MENSSTFPIVFRGAPTGIEGHMSIVAMPSVLDEDLLKNLMEFSSDRLASEEVHLAQAMSSTRRTGFIAGRIAMRSALVKLRPDLAHIPVLRTPRGAPLLPKGMLGSISHKRRLAVAIATMDSSGRQTIGIDIEDIPVARDLNKSDIAPMILTTDERRLLNKEHRKDNLQYREAVRLRFALKEAVYKVLDPHVHRYVRFKEVEVFPDENGGSEVRIGLPEFAHRGISIRTSWQRFDNHLIVVAHGEIENESL